MTIPALARKPKVLQAAHAHDSDVVEDVIPEIEQQIGDGLSILPFPAQLTPGSKGLVQKGLY